MLLTIHIWRYKSVNMAIYLSQRKTTVNALQVASLYARWIQRYLIHKDIPMLLVYSSRVQTANNYVRDLLFNYQQSTMIQQRNVWIYHFPTPRQRTVRWPGNKASPPRTQVLVNAGLLFNASACHVSTEDLHLYPTLRGSMQTELNTPHTFLPDKVPIILQHESHQLQELTMPTLQALDSIQAHLATTLHSIDIDSLLHMHQTSRKSQTEIRWHTIIIILISIILLLGLWYFLLRSHFDKLRSATTKHKTLHMLPTLKPHFNIEIQNHDRETQNTMSCSQVTHCNKRTKAAAPDVYQSGPENASPVIANRANST